MVLSFIALAIAHAAVLSIHQTAALLHSSQCLTITYMTPRLISTLRAIFVRLFICKRWMTHIGMPAQIISVKASRPEYISHTQLRTGKERSYRSLCSPLCRQRALKNRCPLSRDSTKRSMVGTEAEIGGSERNGLPPRRRSESREIAKVFVEPDRLVEAHTSRRIS